MLTITLFIYLLYLASSTISRIISDGTNGLNQTLYIYENSGDTILKNRKLPLSFIIHNVMSIAFNCTLFQKPLCSQFNHN